MLIGLDFDNTIVCYDRALASLAGEFLNLPDGIPRTKLELSNYLRSSQRGKEWTEFQGRLYGPGMSIANPFFGAIEVMQKLQNDGHELMIISHRTLKPFAGPPYDLHAAANTWINEWLCNAGLFVGETFFTSVFFKETLESKISMIAESGCEVFLDDLTSVLDDENFPNHVVKVLFDPSENGGSKTYKKISSWAELPFLIERLD